MALEGHLTGLNMKHKRLEAELEEARLHPSLDPLQLSRLKREKLRVKDELARLSDQHSGSHEH